jgi:endoplasmic reticulum-Golgi intermediate compartment protein 3
MGEAWDKLRRLDAFGKVNEDFFTRTMAGGVITVVSSLIMAILFFSELRKRYNWTLAASVYMLLCAAGSPLTRCAASAGLFLTVRTESHLSVDTSRGEKLQINVSRTHARIGSPRVGLHGTRSCQVCLTTKP